MTEIMQQNEQELEKVDHDRLEGNAIEQELGPNGIDNATMVKGKVIDVNDEKIDNAKGLDAENDGGAASTSNVEEDPAYSVMVYVYDLSHGMAKMYSPMILGIPIDAIYHTSIVVYSHEYYLDQGIKTCVNPGNTKYDLPIDVLDMGETFINQDIFQDFLEELRNHEYEKYHAKNYDLFDNNCNHFTNACLDFLLGKKLDDKILKLPDQVLNTPNGQLLKNMIGNRSL